MRKNITMNEDESVTAKRMKAFPNEKASLQHSVLGYKIDLYFPEHKLAVEVDEKAHTDRNINYEIDRKKAVEKKVVYLVYQLNLLELILMQKTMILFLN